MPISVHRVIWFTLNIPAFQADAMVNKAPSPTMAIIPADQEGIAKATSALKDGQLVAFPTETVYGLGGDALNPDAVARIFATKARPSFNPLIIHVADLATAERFGTFSATARALAKHFWPGALTLVVPLKSNRGIADLVTAGLETIAIRVPEHDVAQNLLRAVGRPLAAPSANRSGAVSPTSPAHVASDLGHDFALILDGGATSVGLESTVVAVDGDNVTLLRPGGVPRQAIESHLGSALRSASKATTTPQSPGQLASHYAPRAAVRLNATALKPGEALLSFGPNAPQTEAPSFNLSVSGDVTEAAVNLFAALRALDSSGVRTIAVMTIPEHGLGEAINDRLCRAAAPRPVPES